MVVMAKKMFYIRRKEDTGRNSQVKGQAGVTGNKIMVFTAWEKNKADGRKPRDLPVSLCDGSSESNNLKLFSIHKSSQILQYKG